jgi:hypothetical protein
VTGVRRTVRAMRWDRGSIIAAVVIVLLLVIALAFGGDEPLRIEDMR